MHSSPARASLFRLLALCLSIRHALAGRYSYTSVTLTRTVYITVFLNAATSGTASPAPTSSTIATPAMSNSNSLQSAVLNSTNYYRSVFQAQDLVWNDTLADFAEDYAQGCIWQHSVSHSPPKQSPPQILTTTEGRPLRREPRRRLSRYHPRHRRLGQRRKRLCLWQGQILGGDRPLHAVSLDQHHVCRLWSGGL
jgi:hypothetical protein